jgi:glycine oxidase
VNVAVIGSGVIGLTIAFRLAQRGAIVFLIDQSAFGKESSWAGAGILPPANHQDPIHAIDHLSCLSNQLHPQLSKELLELTGIDNEYQACGGIYLASTSGEAASLTGSTHLWTQQGIPFEELEPNSVVELEPNLAGFLETQFKKAIWVPGESQLRNPLHNAALVSACQKLGVVFSQNEEVHQLIPQTNSVQLVTAHRSFWVDAVCVATGAWTTKLLQDFSSVQVVPIKGHMLLYKHESPPFSRIINEGNRYIVPRRDGHVLVGSSEEETGFDKSLSKTEIQKLADFAETITPLLSRDSLAQTWTGLRPMSFDGLPYLGPHSAFKNVFLATGHFRSGLQLSTGTAEIITKMLFQEPIDFDVSSLRPER